MTVLPVRIAAAGAIAAAALLGASAANATLGEAVFTGYVQAGVGATGPFGEIGGQAFTAIYDFDTSLGHHDLSPGVEEVNYGGTITGQATNPMLSASLTINGITQTFNPSAYGNDQTFTQFVGTPSGPQLSDDILFVAQGPGGELLNYFNTAPGLMGGDFSHSFSVTPSGPGVIGTVGTLYEPGQGGVSLDADHLTVTMQLGDQGAGGVPEPAAWALMLMGFGGLGAMLRRKHRIAVV
jgi:hypothetical protein